MSDALVLQDITKRYGTFVAVDRLSLRVPTGCIYGFLGPNGAGKTTTIRMIMSILYPDSGEMRVLDQPRAVDVKDRIGYLPEERGLYRKMTVESTLRYIAQLKGVPTNEISGRIEAGLARVGLADWRRKRVEALSKGMAQKVQILAAILHRPTLVILDEPFSGLDPLNVELIKEVILELKQSGATVILSTHQLELAQRLCERVVMINRGRVLAEGTPHDVRAKFAMRTVILEGDGDLAAAGRVAGVARASVSGGHAEFELAEGIDPTAVLRAALTTATITRFEVQRPDLQQVFVRLIGGDDELARRASGKAE